MEAHLGVSQELRHKTEDATLEVSVGASPSLNQTCDTLELVHRFGRPWTRQNLL